MKNMTVGALLDLLYDIPRELEVFISDNWCIKRANDISMEEIRSENGSFLITKNIKNYNAIVISEHSLEEEETE